MKNSWKMFCFQWGLKRVAMKTANSFRFGKLKIRSRLKFAKPEKFANKTLDIPLLSLSLSVSVRPQLNSLAHF